MKWMKLGIALALIAALGLILFLIVSFVSSLFIGGAEILNEMGNETIIADESDPDTPWNILDKPAVTYDPYAAESGSNTPRPEPTFNDLDGDDMQIVPFDDGESE